MKKDGLHKKCSKQWLKDLQKALECPTFKYTPHENQREPDSARYTKEEIANIRTAQCFEKNHND